MKFIILLFIFTFASQVYSKEVKFCTPVQKFDLNPYREILDGKDMAYLPSIFLSYISTDPTEVGIFDAYEFSPDGKTFKARINKKLKWNDNSNITSKEAAFNIAKTLEYRPLGKRIKIVGQNKSLNTIKDIDTVSGIKILSDDLFEIRFESDIKNITGVLREALATGSRHNRFWLVSQDVDGIIKYASRHPVSKVTPNSLELSVDDISIKFVNGTLCKNAELGIYPDALQTNLNNYTSIPSPIQSAVSAVFNTNMDLKTRNDIALNIKKAFASNDQYKEVQSVSSFYLQGEPGYSNLKPWSNIKVSKSQSTLRYDIFFEIPVFKAIMKRSCSQCIFIGTDSSKAITGASVQLLSSAIFGGRHIILQDLLKWNGVAYFLKNAKQTVKMLNKISELSASTIPPDNKTLLEFELVSFKEMSVMPVARRTLVAYSAKNSPIYMDWNTGGEILFKRR